MNLKLLEFLPKFIYGKTIAIGLPGEKIFIGKRINNFHENLKDIKIKRVNDFENPKDKILRALSFKGATLDELSKETNLSCEDLRWHIIRSRDSLLKTGFVVIKRKIFCPHREYNGGVIKIQFEISDKGKNQKCEIKQKNPNRKELIVINFDNQEYVLSSWWSSWLKPTLKNLEFDNLEQRFLYTVPEDQIGVQYEKSKNVLYSTILPKEIEVDEEQFITALGLLLGEMRVRESDISFSNTESFLANYVLGSLKYFGIPKEDFKFSIQVNTRDYKPKHDDLIDYWSKELGINKSNLSAIFEYKNYGTNRGKNGRIDFIYWNIILKEIINNLINYFLVNSIENKNYAIYMLRGLLAAEGYVCCSAETGALDRVGISSCSAHNKEQITKLLNLLGITSSIRKNAVVISSRKNFNKIMEFNLLKISKDESKFATLYNKLRYKKEELLKI